MTEQTEKPNKSVLQRPGWTLGQLQQYIQIKTGNNKVRVLQGKQPASHGPSESVQLDMTDPMAPIAATHEALHLRHSDWKPIESLKTAAERIILNAIEDARIERLAARTEPGVRPQLQEALDLYWPVIREEDGIIQAIKVIYMAAAGYTFPRNEMKPAAKKVLERFERSGVIPQIRKAQSEADLVPLVPIILKMFEFPPRGPMPERPQPAPSKNKGQGDEKDDLLGMSGEAKVGDDDNDAGGNDPYDDAEGGEGDEDGEGEGEGEEGEGEGEEGEGEGRGNVRKARTYDVDEEGNRAEVQKRLGEKPKAAKPMKGRVDGFDRAKGGPSVNRLIEQGDRAAKRLEQIERKIAYNPVMSEGMGGGSGAAVSSSGPVEMAKKGSGEGLPKEISERITGFDEDEKAQYGNIDLSSLLDRDPLSKGGTGYQNLSRYHVQDWRKARNEGFAKEAVGVTVAYSGVTNYLAQQIKVFMQSKGRNSPRRYEHWGKVDPKRISALASGRIDVFKKNIAPSDKSPAVLLTTDTSGSMGGGLGNGLEHVRNTAAYHAMSATLVMGDALNRLRIPFECHTFDSYGGMVKPFVKPWDEDTQGAISNIASHGGGGTQATHALAMAYARILTRPEPRKIIIQVTDGGVPDDTRKMAEFIQRKGVIVIGIGIGMRGVMDRYYPHYVEVDNAHDLPAAFARLLRELLPSGDWR
jgi:hypothetical protein